MFDYLNTLHPSLPTITGLVLLLLLALLADIIARRLLLAGLHAVVSRTTSQWDDALLQHKVFKRLSQVLPALVIHGGILLVPGIPAAVEVMVRNVAGAWMILMFMLTLTAVLSAINQIYETTGESKERPIKGFVQMAEIGVYLVGGILVIAALIGRSPVVLLSGLGAMTAILMIVFKDTLLSLAASIQLTSQNVIRVGDWLEIPQFGADGDVIDVALYTITVQNWDKTVTTIPTYKLISDSFKNWRGMQEAGGRRIKRSVNLDFNTIRVLSDDEIKHFEDFALLRDYVARKQKELKEYNDALDRPGKSGVNLRRLTNIGTFRAYVYNYLKHHPKIHDEMTLIVRQLQPGPEGLPLEIYCFTNDTNWVNYEGIQSDIIDHICAIAPEFGLRIFQSPAGTDFSALVRGPESNE
jgi:miniconductance mechanosensitive channel